MNQVLKSSFSFNFNWNVINLGVLAFFVLYLMYFGDINLYIMFFILIMISITVNVSSALHLLLTAEILWITLYVLVLSLGILYDNANFLSLTFFFLVLSAVEFGVGLVLLLVQNVFTRSLNLNDNSKNDVKYSTRFLNKLKTVQTPWL